VRRIPRGMPAVRHLRHELKAAAEQMAAEERESLRRTEERHAASVLRAAAKDAALAGALGPTDRGGHPRRPATSGRLRTVAFTAFALLLLTVTAPALRDFVADDGSRGSGPGAPKADQPLPPGLQPSLAVARDPIERRYPWGVRTYASRRGNCILTGRLLGGQVGRLQDGKFAALGQTMVGFCGSLRREHIVFTIRDYYKLSGGRTILYGITDRRIASLDLLTAGGAERRAVRIADDDSFVAVRLGAQAFRGQNLRITFTDGSVRMVALQPGLPKRRHDARLP
jgi:hypothetical protein